MTTKTLRDICETVLQIEEDKKGTNGYMKVKGRFQAAETRNANGRIYPSELWERVLKESEIQDMIESRRMLGCVEHPTSGVTALSDVSHIVTGLYREGNDIIGEAEVLNTPQGLIIQELLRRKVPIGISSRGRGTSLTKNGVEYVNPDDFILETFDFVYKPSTPGAYPSLAESALSGTVYSKNTPMITKLDTAKKFDVRAGEISANVLAEKDLSNLHALMRECLEMRTAISNLVKNFAEADKTDDYNETYLSKVSERIDEAHKSVTNKLDSIYMGSSVSRKIETVRESKSDKSDELLNKLLDEAKQENEYLRNRLNELDDNDELERRYNAATKLAEETLTKLEQAHHDLAELSQDHDELLERYEAAVALVAGVEETAAQGQMADLVQEAIESYPALKKFEKVLQACKNEDELVERVADLLEASGLNESITESTKGRSTQTKPIVERLSFAGALQSGGQDTDEVINESVIPSKNKKIKRASASKVLDESQTTAGPEDDLLSNLLEITGGK